MDPQGKTREDLISELHKLHNKYDLLKVSFSKEVIERRQTEQTLIECENSLKERIKELDGIYSLGNLAEELTRLEDIYHAFVNRVVPGSFQFPEAVFVSLEIDRKKYVNIENFKLLEGQKYLSAPIKIYGKQVGEFIVAYTEDLPTIDYFEQKLISNYAERISKITERIKTEQTLEESEIKHRNLIDNLGEGIGIVDINEEFLFANHAAERIFGVGEGELSGKNLKKFLSEEQYSDILRQTRVREKKQSSSYATELTLLDGKKRQIQVTAVPNLDSDENFIGTLAVFRDITENIKAEHALKESEKEFRSLAESMPQIVWTTRADGWNIYCNRQWVDYTGLTLEESYGYGWNKPFHPDDKQQAWDAWHNAVNNQAEYSIECRLRCHDGTYHWWLVRGIPQISAGGEIKKWIGTCTDIEKIKLAEQALKESERKLLQLNADKDRFISILGHDLRSPFNNILGLSEVLIEDMRKLNIDEIENIAGNINKSAIITNKLLEDILLWARAQQGMIPINPTNLSFSETCRNILVILNPGVYAKNITIYSSSAENINVYADSDMLKTILLNIVSNAIKFTNRGGKITINAEQNSENITISVSDNGVGIPPENLVKLFDISEILTTKGTAGETGTGLGLLLCREFIEKHGGRIWVESEAGKGSRFKFTLPVIPEKDLRKHKNLQ